MMISKKIKPKGAYEIFISILSLVFVLYLIIFSETASKGAGEGLDICMHVILVTVFPFSVASRLFTASGCADLLGKVIGKPLRKIFGISSEGAGAVIIGAVGGYPTGAAVCSELYKNGLIEKNEAERLISYTNNATPAFIIGYVGGYLASAGEGVFCYFCILAASFIWGFIIKDKNFKSDIIKTPAVNKSFPFVKATAESAVSAVVICGFIIIFSVITSAVSSFIKDRTVIALLTSLFEITSGIGNISDIGSGPLAGAVICAVASFSGLCVFAQVRSECSSSGLSCRYYLPGKLFQSAVSFILFYLLYPLIFCR